MAVCLVIIIWLWSVGGCVEPVTGSGMFSAIKSVISTGYGSVRCSFATCCNDWRIIKNFTGLKHDLASKLHGQHLVEKIVVRHLLGHMKAENPPKALALSFHGPTGVGKSFVSRIIADNMYQDGVKSPFVHMFSATREFNHKRMVPIYKDQLKLWIEGNVTKCGQSMFIFDEVDKIPGKLMDVVKPYMDYYEHLGGVSYRKAIFLFLSNTDDGDIAKILLDLWRSGRSRELLELSEVEGTVMKAAVNADNKKGLWHSQLISSHLITAYIPFLPLEKQHVRKCIVDDLLSKHPRLVINEQDKIVDDVMKELTFSPATEQIFSSTGCKRVSDKVDYVILDSSVLTESIESDNRHSEF